MSRFTEQTTNDTSHSPAVKGATSSPSRRQRLWATTWKTGTLVLLISILGVDPVLATKSSVCDVERLPQMITGFFRLTTTVGVVGLAIIWQADSLIDIFTLNPEQKKRLKRHKRSAIKSATILVVLGPLYTVAGSMMGLPLAECIDLVS